MSRLRWLEDNAQKRCGVAAESKMLRNPRSAFTPTHALQLFTELEDWQQAYGEMGALAEAQDVAEEQAQRRSRVR